ncbi:hypothetical protein CONCODRAFT_6655 [Conidiobolus coronatus NRRL 28638]|uniref:Galactose oxidase n=1 Tax=Conidiobolus coronatus (strain ATCC 28846 / CBS 209.66 / NRRL 28638) TaxID=796925 RepID=A0A137P6V4_CONC2|nr:hypothetical protein CONCODRAFT_6655 [Conidiobolus coronatus NRRL 28638]|eukprot:KXN70725.1 hypothetical protein CONCODRAFT_6655 [Conidiobolus coronatus NRRL 28638]
MDYGVDSVTIKDNKLYMIYENEDNIYRVVVIDLKNGPISDIFSSGKIYKLGNFFDGFKLKFINNSEILPEDANKLWIKAMPNEIVFDIDRSFSDWVGYIDLNDMSLKTDTSIIKFPATDKFPLFGYTMNTITNEHGSAIYITGGVVQSKVYNTFMGSNSFFKYNHTTKEWVDMASNYTGILDPIYHHKSLVLDNRYLVLLGGQIPKNPTINSNLFDYNSTYFIFKSMYNLTIFDTLTNSWENTAISADIWDNEKRNLGLAKFCAVSYNNKVYVIGGFILKDGVEMGELNLFLGTLDYKTKTWSWNPMFNEDGSKFIYSIVTGDMLVYNEQIIIPHFMWPNGTLYGFVYDLPSQKMATTFRLSDSTDSNIFDAEKSKAQEKPSALPTYEIALISLCCIALLAIIIFVYYRKFKRNKPGTLKNDVKSNARMQAVWSNLDNPDMDRVIIGDKKKGFHINTGTSASQNFNDLNNRDNRLKSNTNIEFENQ